MLSPTIVVDGKVVGTWSRTFDKGTLIVKPNLFVPLASTHRDALAAAARRYGRFLGLTAALK